MTATVEQSQRKIAAALGGFLIALDLGIISSLVQSAIAWQMGGWIFQTDNAVAVVRCALQLAAGVTLLCGVRVRPVAAVVFVVAILAATSLTSKIVGFVPPKTGTIVETYGSMYLARLLFSAFEALIIAYGSLVLVWKKKAAEPGATDNPEDAQ